MRKVFTIVAALCAVWCLSGCGGGLGPVTIGNLVNNYPPRVRGLAVNLEASLVVVDFQPRDADVWIEGWFIVPNDPEGAGRREIRFTDNLIEGVDDMSGRAQFVMSGWDWGWGNPALQSGVTYYFMLTVEDPDGSRTSVSTWRFRDGVITLIA